MMLHGTEYAGARTDSAACGKPRSGTVAAHAFVAANGAYATASMSVQPDGCPAATANPSADARGTISVTHKT